METAFHMQNNPVVLDAPASPSYVIPSVDRAFEILERLAVSDEGLSLADLARATGFPKSTVFRILATLEPRGVVTLDAATRTYALGHRLWLYGHRFVEQLDLYQAAKGTMQRLAERAGETVFLGKLDGAEVIYLHRIESPRSVAIVKKLGERAPAYCTATGTAILAFLTPAETERLLTQTALARHTDATIVEPDVLRARLAETRAQGFVVVNGEYNRELMCIAAPVFDHTGHARASLTVAMPAAHLPSEARQREVGVLVRDAAQSLSRRLGAPDAALPGIASGPAAAPPRGASAP